MNKYTFDELFSLKRLPESDFEKFALNIIECEVEARQKRVFKGNDAVLLINKRFGIKGDYRITFDAVAPLGISDSLFTIVEIKKNQQIGNRSYFSN